MCCTKDPTKQTRFAGDFIGATRSVFYLMLSHGHNLQFKRFLTKLKTKNNTQNLTKTADNSNSYSNKCSLNDEDEDDDDDVVKTTATADEEMMTGGRLLLAKESFLLQCSHHDIAGNSTSSYVNSWDP